MGMRDGGEPRALLRQEQERMLQESRKSGTRSVAIALAEIQIISSNVYVERAPRKLHEEEFPVCSCAPPPDGCLGCLDGCVNRAVLVECVESHCPCGVRCANQRIQRGVMPAVSIEDCGAKGLGLFLRQEVRAGDFVGEYMGEIVTETEYHMRRLRYHHEKHRYMMVLSGGEVIDATRMGGYARFINHSCEPNCGVEKWEVNGEERCGIFALRDIHDGEELTFDYKFESFSKLEITKCLCGSARCRQVIGMNNKAVKASGRAGAAAASGQAIGPERPKLLDPIGGKHRQGKKVADSLLDRIARTLFHRKLLTKKEVERLRASRVMLYRNFTQHLDTNFRFLCLEQYFLALAKRDAAASSSRASSTVHVPPVIQPRALPGYPVKQKAKESDEEKHVRSLRLEAIVVTLHEQSWGRAPPPAPLLSTEAEAVTTTESSSDECSVTSGDAPVSSTASSNSRSSTSTTISVIVGDLYNGSDGGCQ
ncbi:hypothetical protein PybrP1_009320 [[Pythium] brassicae (nom. inval.)]|nr:hypothetical protein PybrP1_009320 [[Pythium] brassicae (nom. inval.)]